jgi:DcaP outer membrane protein
MPMSTVNRKVALARDQARVRRTVLSLLASSAAVTITGAPAFADELADLRANQELLQARIEQLAQVGDAGSPVGKGTAVTGGSFPRSFVIPGTDTSLRIGGEARLSIDYLLSGGGNNINGLPTNTIGSGGLLETTPLSDGGHIVPGIGAPPVDLAHSRSHYIMFSPRESRLHIETRTPTAFGEASTVFEFDFLGGVASTADPAQVANSLIPRLRHAYATVGPWQIGQTYTWLFDAESHTETIDFGGEPSLGPDRQPQIRYTGQMPMVPGTVFALELDNPDTDVQTAAGKFDSDNTTAFPGVVAFPAGVGTANPAGGTINPAVAQLPDAVFGLQYDAPWMHLRFGAVARDLRLDDGRFINKTYVGYGGGVQGWVKPGWLGWERDQVQWGFGAGDGIGRQITGSTNSALDTNYGAFAVTAANAGAIIYKPIVEWAGWTGYTHYWLENLRSNLSFGVRHEDFNSNLIGPSQSEAANKELVTAHANIIWAPLPFADIGLEYFFGHRQTVANLKGDINSIQTRFRMRF